MNGLAVARMDRPELTAVMPGEVIPDGVVELIGPDDWALTSAVNTVFEVVLVEPDALRADGDATLSLRHDAAWITYPHQIEVLAADGVREAHDGVLHASSTMTLRIVNEARSETITWVDRRTGHVPNCHGMDED